MALQSHVTDLAKRSQVPIPASNIPNPNPNPSKGSEIQSAKWKLTKYTDAIVDQNSKK